MGSDRGFIEINRIEKKYEPVESRVKHYNEFTLRPKHKELEAQEPAAWIAEFPTATQWDARLEI